MVCFSAFSWVLWKGISIAMLEYFLFLKGKVLHVALEFGEASDSYKINLNLKQLSMSCFQWWYMYRCVPWDTFPIPARRKVSVEDILWLLQYVGVVIRAFTDLGKSEMFLK